MNASETPVWCACDFFQCLTTGRSCTPSIQMVSSWQIAFDCFQNPFRHLAPHAPPCSDCIVCERTYSMLYFVRCRFKSPRCRQTELCRCLNDVVGTLLRPAYPNPHQSMNSVFGYSGSSPHKKRTISPDPTIEKPYRTGGKSGSGDVSVTSTQRRRETLLEPANAVLYQRILIFLDPSLRVQCTQMDMSFYVHQILDVEGQWIVYTTEQLCAEDYTKYVDNDWHLYERRSGAGTKSSRHQLMYSPPYHG